MKNVFFFLVAISSVSAQAGQASKMRSSLAQNTNVQRGSSLWKSQSSSAEMKNNISLMGGAILASGFGVSYERSILSQVSLGGFISTYKLQAKAEGGDTYISSSRIKFQLVGLKSRYFFGHQTDQSGWYAKGILASVNVKAEVDFFKGGGLAADKSAVGLQLGAGYQWLAGKIAGAPIAFDFGVDYGAGNRGGYSGKTVGGVDTIDPIIASGIGAELTAAVLF